MGRRTKRGHKGVNAAQSHLKSADQFFRGASAAFGASRAPKSFDTSGVAAELRLITRKLRVQYPGAIYHVMNRGDHWEVSFRDERDRERCVATSGEACTKTDWQVHAFWLMSNHFHLMVETPRANLAEGMQWLLGTYTSRFNHRHGLFGHLFSGRYKALPVDGSGNGYLKSVCDYVHLHPVRAGLLAPEQPLQTYVWSSYPLYLRGQRPQWVRLDRLLGEWGIPQDSVAALQRFALQMEARRAGENGRFQRFAPGLVSGQRGVSPRTVAANGALK